MPQERSWRAEVVDRTAGYAVWLGRLPRWLPLVVVAALVAGGLVVGGVVGAVLLLVVALLTGWLAALGWDGTPPAGRVVRLVVVAVLVGVAALEAAAG